jgi:cytochrome c-type protein NapB
VLAFVIATAGFFRGLAEESNDRRVRTPDENTPAPPAPGYPDLRSMRRGPNASLYEGAIERLGERLPGVLDNVPPQTDEQRTEVLAARSRLRAFDGAPPTVPHAMRGQSTFECLACHEKGAVIAGKRAPAMSHERHDSCTQCHVSAGGPPAPAPSPLASSSFVGRASVHEGARAWAGAPPMIPHSTAMRESCGSCHGVSGALGMRTTHPWRASCTQCHAPSAALDQRANDHE